MLQVEQNRRVLRNLPCSEVVSEEDLQALEEEVLLQDPSAVHLADGKLAEAELHIAAFR